MTPPQCGTPPYVGNPPSDKCSLPRYALATASIYGFAATGHPALHPHSLARAFQIPGPLDNILRDYQKEKSKMKAYEIPIKVTKEGEIELLDALLELLPREQVVRVIILVPESTDAEEQAAWSRLTTEQFFAGYSEADSIYDRI